MAILICIPSLVQQDADVVSSFSQDVIIKVKLTKSTGNKNDNFFISEEFNCKYNDFISVLVLSGNYTKVSIFIL